LILIDLALFSAIAALCWRGYQQRRIWIRLPPYLLMQRCRGKSALRQLLIFGPVTIFWLLTCHWINTHGWHATAAGGLLLAMTLGLEAMRAIEEQQKQNKKP